MPEIEITCQYVNAPKPGKRLGSVKSSEGEYYYVDPIMLKRFSVGEVCTIEYEAKPRDGGGEWKTIKRKISTSAAPPVPQIRARTAPADSKQIFVTALLKGMVTPQDTVTTIIAKGGMVKNAYEQLFGTEAKQTTETIMKDEIPDEF